MIVSSLEESLHSTYGSSSPRRRSDGDEDSLTDSQRLKFADLQIREYSRAVGDNPSVSAGPPLSMGWEYNEAQTIPLDDYESCRGPRRTSPEMAVPRSIRESLLKNEWGVPRSDIAHAVREVVRTKNRRRTTVQNMDKFARAEELAESARRKCKRFVLRKKRDSALYDEWRREAERARAAIDEENRASAAVRDSPASSMSSTRGRMVVVVAREADDDVNRSLACDPALEGAPRRSSGAKIAPSQRIAPPQKLIICSEEDGIDAKVPTEKVSEQSSGAATYEVFPSLNTSLRASCA
eukprot:CAMPEP_0113557134 /NCGR_PEP_ID=MMETSP0015_2-20120614/17625_1 /TAXON_ID=2838 /ORGANISM="Odontella" /LENGTH=294 /DNA_ID=CAMNT_0000458531 /DNA_START=337 /DNA_END=1221 /DNA_ORIENTATION=+ /assembly_acc=CAM_ASM_000160